MSMKQVIKELALLEGKKVEVSVGNLREILALISDIFYQDLTSGDNPQYTYNILLKNGKRRAKSKKVKSS